MHGSEPVEYLRRNLVVAKACGLKEGIKATTQRLRSMSRVPRWLFASLTAMHERAADLPPELARWRDASPDSPFAAKVDSSECWWAVFPCGWKWDIGDMTREEETPVAIFEHKHHATDFKNLMWPSLGEVRAWQAPQNTKPSNAGK